MSYSRRAALVLLILGLLWAGSSSFAAKVKVWQQHQHSHFDKAQFKHAIVTSEGALRLSRDVKLLANLHATNVWDVVEDKTGHLFVATGDEGKLWKVQAEAVRKGMGEDLILGHYRLLDLLGQGGMGTVYRAEHIQLRRLVALKVMARSIEGNARQFERIVAEIGAKGDLVDILRRHFQEDIDRRIVDDPAFDAARQ